MSGFPVNGGIETVSAWLINRGFNRFVGWYADELLFVEPDVVFELYHDDKVLAHRVVAALTAAKTEKGSGLSQTGSSETSGFISVSGSISPVPWTLGARLNDARRTHDPLYYMALWRKVMKQKRQKYRISVDLESQTAAIKKGRHSVIVDFALADPAYVRNLYICFRLCGDDVATFLWHLRHVLNHKDIHDRERPVICRQEVL
jgi:hypothetical protein